MSRLVVGVDGSPHADRALRWAVREAQLWPADVELVYAFSLHPYASAAVLSDEDRAEATMDAIVQRNKAVLDDVKWTSTLLPRLGAPTGVLIEVGEDADLIVVGSRGLEGFGELFLGATSYRTAAHATVPVAVIPSRDDAEGLDADRSIVVGIDDSRAAGRALRLAFDEAQRRQTDVTVVHAYYQPSDPSDASVAPREELEELRQRAHRAAVAVVDAALDTVKAPRGVDVERVVASGSPAGVLLRRAGVDRLLIVGTHGRGALGRMMFGSVSHQCLHHAKGPVVVVP